MPAGWLIAWQHGMVGEIQASHVGITIHWWSARFHHLGVIIWRGRRLAAVVVVIDIYSMIGMTSQN
jgi:hypothetical protein